MEIVQRVSHQIMIMLEEKRTVHSSVETAFRYVSDFRTIEEWDPGVMESVKQSFGPTGPGISYRLRLRYGPVASDVTYTIRDYDKPKRLVLDGSAESYAVTDTIEFYPMGSDKTRICYRAEIRFKKPLPSPFFPVVALLLKRMGKRAVDGLERALNTQVPPTPGMNCVRTLLDRSMIGGLFAFTRFGFNHSKTQWKPVVPDLGGKTVVLTGGTSGIGLAAAEALAHRGARLILLSRDLSKADRVRYALTDKTGNEAIEIRYADMADIRSVIYAAQDLASREPCVDVLVNNAGALYSERIVTPEGFEKTFATNLLGPYVLTEHLLPALKKAGQARIVNVSSGGMYLQAIREDDLQYEQEDFDGATAYARCKRGLVMLTEHWSGRLAPYHISVHAMHPGWVATPGLKRSLPGFYRFMKPLMRNPEQGADTLVWLAVAPEAAKTSGRFWLDRKPHVTHVLKKTRETAEQRQSLVSQLRQMMRKGGP